MHSEGAIRTVTTSSEIFADGSAIELVASADGEDVALLRWDGERASIVSQLEHSGRVYKPPYLHASILRAVRLPGTIADYGAPGALFREITTLFEEYGGLSASGASLLTYWNASTWFADHLPSPPALTVSGPDLSQAITLFQLIRCVCRRGLILGEMTRSAFGSLPMELRPTMMIAQPELPRRLWSLWSASNYQGTFIPGSRGTVLDVVGSKAIFTGLNGTSSWGDHTLHLALQPTPSKLPRPDGREQQRIADKFLPQLLKYRLLHLGSVRESCFAHGEVKYATGELGRNLLACVADESELAKSLVPHLEAQEQDRLQRRSCDPSLAIVEVLWTKLDNSQGEIGISRLADLTNALLLSRGAGRTYGPEELGWKLRQMGISRHKGRDSMVVRFSRETSLRVHKLARGFGLNLSPHPNTCTDCKAAS
jgi:hypothetical protein